MADTTAPVTPSTDGAPEAPSQDTQTQDAPVTDASTPDPSTDETDSSTAESTDPQETPQDATDGDSTEDSQDQSADDEQESDADGEGDSDDEDAEDTSTDVERLQRSNRKARREAANLRTRLKAAETEALRYKTAMAAGIPEDAMEFLHGDTQEALEASAEKLLVMMGYHGRVTPPGGPVENGGNPRRGDFTTVDQARQTTDLDSIGSRIYEH